VTDDPAAAPTEPTGLLGPADVRRLSEALGVRPTKTLGQNFVHDAGTVRRIVRSAAVGPEDVVLEVGPGLGSLTLALLETGARVVAVEIDPPLAEALPATVAARMPEAAGRLAVLHADAMTVTGPGALPVPGGETDGAPTGAVVPTKLVANLPYNVAVPVLLTLLENLPSLREVLVMVQAEVADRIAAPPGSRTYGVPSAKAAWYAEAARAGTISRSVFWPVPNVDSALVRLTRREPPETTATRAEVFAVVDAAFAQRRKTLRAALAGWAGSAAAAEEVLRAAGIDPGLRGERLGIVDFARIAQHARSAGASGTRSGTLGA
jgi:16S rRNA (adenine1518-N6/adenine1519-N6)-dimethyltransferase